MNSLVNPLIVFRGCKCRGMDIVIHCGVFLPCVSEGSFLNSEVNYERVKLFFFQLYFTQDTWLKDFQGTGGGQL